MSDFNRQKRPQTTSAEYRKMRDRIKARDLIITTFFAFLIVMALIGLLLPLRPKTSAVEKRDLEKWPAFSIAAIWDGSYFDQISTWYADTFPFRETLIKANSAVKGLYGLQGEQIIHNDSAQKDDIPTDDETEAPEDEMTEEEKAAEEAKKAEEAAKKAEEEKEKQIDEESAIGEDGEAINVVPEPVGSLYVAGDTAYDLFYFYREGADQYIDYVDMIQDKLDGIAQVYDIIAPTSIGIMLTDEAQEKLGISSQKEAIAYAFKAIGKKNDKVKTVNVCRNLIEHNGEYIYFRTDHHWTALGAYYGYQAFCEEKGITPTPIEDYETMEFDNFLGTFYAGAGQPASLEANPDTVIAYIPKATNKMTYIGTDDEEHVWEVVTDVTDWERGSKYNCFIAGDEPYGVIENPNLDDGSACCVIKESYGNAFVPFLVDHYQYTYVVDHRYFAYYNEYGNDFVQLVKDKGIQDVILLNTTLTLCNKDLSQSMADMFE
ncbi:MAG: hypothetical protein IIY84_03950 [Eubacterium sp.]|nr:hypothetical protein [Eubacterium sp.]